jgi:hypothetical protein
MATSSSVLRNFPVTAANLRAACLGITPGRLKNFRAQGYLVEKKDWASIPSGSRNLKEYRYAEHVIPLMQIVLLRYEQIKDYQAAFEEGRKTLHLDK